jgi:hypothetical protein
LRDNLSEEDSNSRSPGFVAAQGNVFGLAYACFPQLPITYFLRRSASGDYAFSACVQLRVKSFPPTLDMRMHEESSMFAALGQVAKSQTLIETPAMLWWKRCAAQR